MNDVLDLLKDFTSNRSFKNYLFLICVFVCLLYVLVWNRFLLELLSHWLVWLICLISIFDSISIFNSIAFPLWQLFLMVEKVFSYVPVKFISLFKILYWQKTCNFCKKKSINISALLRILKQKNGSSCRNSSTFWQSSEVGVGQKVWIAVSLV